jgi:hypothetical protein
MLVVLSEEGMREHLQMFALVFDQAIARFDVNVMLMLMLNVKMDILSHLLRSVNQFIK